MLLSLRSLAFLTHSHHPNALVAGDALADASAPATAANPGLRHIGACRARPGAGSGRLVRGAAQSGKSPAQAGSLLATCLRMGFVDMMHVGRGD